MWNVYIEWKKQKTKFDWGKTAGCRRCKFVFHFFLRPFEGYSAEAEEKGSSRAIGPYASKAET